MNLIKCITTSNRPKHIIGGLLIFVLGLLFTNTLGALYAVYTAAFSLELKDKLHGCVFDWLDLLCTVFIPTLITVIIFLV